MNRNAILIVEDNEHLLEVLCQLVARWGYEVISAASESAACEHIRQRPQALMAVLTDYTLFQGNGLNVARTASEFGVPAILMTGSLPEDMIAAIEHVTTLSKPFEPTKLEHLLRMIEQQAA